MFLLWILFIGIFVGGLLCENEVWIVGLIGAFVFMIIGITIEYRKTRLSHKLNNIIDEAIKYASKIDHITTSPDQYEIFSIAEITSRLINLRDAIQNLNADELSNVYRLKMIFDKMQDDIRLNNRDFLRTATNIIAHFDLVAPYYKFCGDELSIAELIDGEKLEYRKKASRLIKEDQLFSDEWMELHTEFMEHFYRNV